MHPAITEVVLNPISVRFALDAYSDEADRLFRVKPITDSEGRRSSCRTAATLADG